MNVHPKVAASTLAMLAWTALCLILAQYLPAYQPTAPVSSGVGMFLTAFTGYMWPSPADPAPVLLPRVPGETDEQYLARLEAQDK